LIALYRRFADGGGGGREECPTPCKNGRRIVCEGEVSGRGKCPGEYVQGEMSGSLTVTVILNTPPRVHAGQMFSGLDRYLRKSTSEPGFIILLFYNFKLF